MKLNPAIVYLGIPMLMYAMQGVFVYYQEGRYGMMLTMISYAQANIGLIMDHYGI